MNKLAWTSRRRGKVNDHPRPVTFSAYETTNERVVVSSRAIITSICFCAVRPTEVFFVFDSLLSHAQLQRAVAAMGFTTPTPVQAAALPPALQGQDLLVTACTGSGKSLAYLLPVLSHLMDSPSVDAPRALIVLPTRELAQQVADIAQQLARHTWLKVALICGGGDYAAQQHRLAEGPDLIIGTPGRLIDQIDQQHLHLSKVERLVLDEADRLLDMGFTQAVDTLASACAKPRQTLLFSATSGDLGLKRLSETLLHEPKRMSIDPPRQVNTAIEHHLITSDDLEHKARQAVWLLSNGEYDKAIVFCNTRAHAERVYARLTAAKLPAFVLHGERERRERTLAVERLREGSIRILVATDVAARGLDIDGMTLVINLDVPRRGDDYLHRVGRAGRGDTPGTAITLVSHLEWNLMASIERYLKLSIARQVIKSEPALYQGPRKVKASGKAAGSKKSKVSAKAAPKAKKKKKKSKRSAGGKPSAS